MSVKFPFDKKKAEQAVLWLLHRHGGALPVLKLVKLVFYADREHLARYGRPIIGGRYAAMPHGPVASELKTEIDKTKEARSRAPFARKGNSLCASSPVDEEYLSESEVEVLDEVNRKYGKLDAFTLRDMTHELKAWKKNYKHGQAKKSYALPYEDFFADLDPSAGRMLELIREDHESRAAFE